jgi:hypothetical protein
VVTASILLLEDMVSRRRRFVQASRETNRYFHPDIPLMAPKTGYDLPPRSKTFDQNHKETLWFGEKVARHLYEDFDFGILRGKRQFAYPIMALLVRKDYGDIDAALEAQVLCTDETVHEPFVTQEEDGSFYCPPQQALMNPLSQSQFEQKSYDPSSLKSVGEQLAVGRAEKEGDIFEWRSSMHM